MLGELAALTGLPSLPGSAFEVSVLDREQRRRIPSGKIHMTIRAAIISPIRPAKVLMA